MHSYLEQLVKAAIPVSDAYQTIVGSNPAIAENFSKIFFQSFLGYMLSKKGSSNYAATERQL